jgi:uncharacterized protein YggE
MCADAQEQIAVPHITVTGTSSIPFNADVVNLSFAARAEEKNAAAAARNVSSPPAQLSQRYARCLTVLRLS